MSTKRMGAKQDGGGEPAAGRVQALRSLLAKVLK